MRRKKRIQKFKKTKRFLNLQSVEQPGKWSKAITKRKKGVIVKHAIDPISIVSLRKKNNENVKQIADQIFKSWKV